MAYFVLGCATLYLLTYLLTYYRTICSISWGAIVNMGHKDIMGDYTLKHKLICMAPQN